MKWRSIIGKNTVHAAKVGNLIMNTTLSRVLNLVLLLRGYIASS